MWEVVIRCNRQCRTDRDSRTREGGLQKNIMVMLQLLFLNIEVQDLFFTLTYAILEYSCALPALCVHFLLVWLSVFQEPEDIRWSASYPPHCLIIFSLFPCGVAITVSPSGHAPAHAHTHTHTLTIANNEKKCVGKHTNHTRPPLRPTIRPAQLEGLCEWASAPHNSPMLVPWPH